jgi:hypothetical protein
MVVLAHAGYNDPLNEENSTINNTLAAFLIVTLHVAREQVNIPTPARWPN